MELFIPDIVIKKAFTLRTVQFYGLRVEPGTDDQVENGRALTDESTRLCSGRQTECEVLTVHLQS